MGLLEFIRQDNKGGLTARQRDVVRLISTGKSNKEIACTLGLTRGTVKEYLYKIFRLTGVQSRTELALWAVSGGREEPLECLNQV